MAVFWCQVITLCFALAHAVTAIEAKEVSKPVSKGVQLASEEKMQRLRWDIYQSVARDATATARRLIGRVDSVADIRDANNRTLLHLAAERANVEMTRLLLCKGADVSARDADRGNEPLHSAITGNTWHLVDMVAWLADAGNNTATPLRRPLSLPAKAKTVKVVEILLDAGAALNATDKYGATALHLAAGANYAKLVSLLLARGADVGARDLRGWTPLMWAAVGVNCGAARPGLRPVRCGGGGSGGGAGQPALEINQLKTIKILMSSGADAEAADWVDAERPLAVAVRANRADVVAALLKKGVRFAARNQRGQSPHDLAVNLQYWDIANILE